MASSPVEVRLPEFRWLIDHAGWQALPPARGDDVQGPDVRERVGKGGVVFSAYRISRNPGRMGRVELDPLPPWAQSTEISCDIPMEELCAHFGFAGDPGHGFEFLNSRLEDVKAFLAGPDFARTQLERAIVRLKQRAALDRSVLFDLRPQLGPVGLMKTLLGTYLFHRRQFARYRRVMRLLRRDRSAQDGA